MPAYIDAFVFFYIVLPFFSPSHTPSSVTTHLNDQHTDCQTRLEMYSMEQFIVVYKICRVRNVCRYSTPSLRNALLQKTNEGIHHHVIDPLELRFFTTESPNLDGTRVSFSSSCSNSCSNGS
mmetsp:Transcript_1308/g.2141  ORF Transcript_1308/g.2141 Transcript_1308/m.2141 type:complete len:122 (-) Transcript_1308:1209-1574(-)